MYFADFVNFEGQRLYVTTGAQSGKTRVERVSNEAFRRFIRSVLSMADPLDTGSNKEVPA